ncbi:MAG: PRC-barrel domain-containing protein, partial [bacterium]
MIKYRSVIGKEVFTVAEGKTFGRVREVMVDLKKLKAVGFLIANKDEMFLETGDITTFGEASLVFEREEMLKPGSKIPSLCVKGRELMGLKVITEKGRDAGNVSTFFFDEKGSITHIEVNEGPFAGKGLLAGTGVSFVGPDAVI